MHRARRKVRANWVELIAEPNRLPTNDVRAMAAAPPTRTRAVGRPRGAPPSRAPVAPSVPSATNATAMVIHTRVAEVAAAMAPSGRAAPIANETIDTTIACTGRAIVVVGDAELLGQVHREHVAGSRAPIGHLRGRSGG